MIEYINLTPDTRLRGNINKSTREVTVSIEGPVNYESRYKLPFRHVTIPELRPTNFSIKIDYTNPEEKFKFTGVGGAHFPLVNSEASRQSVNVKLSTWNFISGNYSPNNPKYKYVGIGPCYYVARNPADIWVSGSAGLLISSCKEITMRNIATLGNNSVDIVITGIFPREIVATIKEQSRNIPEEHRPKITRIYNGIHLKLTNWWTGPDMYYRLGWLFLTIRIIEGRYPAPAANSRLNRELTRFIDGTSGFSYSGMDSINNWIRIFV